MNIKNALSTKRFKYGIIITLISIFSLITIISNEDDAAKEVQQLEQDPRYNPEIWKKFSADQQKKLANELMSAKMRKSQIDLGKPLFIAALIIGLITTLSSLIEIKSKSDKLFEEFDKEE